MQVQEAHRVELAELLTGGRMGTHVGIGQHEREHQECQHTGQGC